MFKTIIKIITCNKPTTKHQKVIIKHDLQFNIYSYESVDDKLSTQHINVFILKNKYIMIL